MGMIDDYELIIWDVDGTLLDTSPGLISSTLFMIEKLGLPPLDKDTLKSFVGPRIQDSLQRVYQLEGKELEEAANVFRTHYKEGDVLKASPYPGVYRVLEYIHNKGIKQAVATNKRQDFVDALLKKYNLYRYMETVCGTDFAGKLTKANLIEQCISQGNVLKSRVLMIGDSDYDAEAASKTGIDFLAVTYGFGYKKQTLNNSSAVMMVDTLNQIL